MRRNDAEPADEPFREAVEQINGKAERLQEPRERARDQKGDALGAREAEAFGNEFAEDDLEKRQQGEGKNYGGGVGRDRRPGPRNLGHGGGDDTDERRLAKIAEQKAGNRDADLHAGNDAAHIGEERFHNAGARVAALDELAHAREPHRHERKLGGRKKGVDADQQENREKLQRDHDSSKGDEVESARPI